MSLPDFIPPIAPLPAVALAPDATAIAPTVGATSAAFSRLVVRGLQQVNDAVLDGQVDMQKLAAGEVGNLHQVMLRLEEARLAFQLMLQVRNRVLESYQELMRTQV